VVLDPPTRQVVDNLVGNDVGSVWQSEQLLHIGQIKVADAPVTNQTIVPQNVKRIYCLFQWHAATPVQQVKVQSIGPQTLQAPLAGDDRAMASGMLGKDFADQEYFVATAGDGRSDELLRSAIRIHLRRVDQREPQ